MSHIAARVFVVVGTLAVLGACTAASTPKPRTLGQTSTAYVVTDARQRVVASSALGNFSRPGLADPNEIVCAEPSPDVATAVATSFSGALSAFGRGSASLSAGQVENLAQLVERTASIQLLRDKMYQSCLAYANGAISGTTYSLIMASLDKTIVTLLLGENAAAAFGRAGAALGTEASASGNAETSGPNPDFDLDKAVAAVKDADTKVAEAEKKLAEVHKAKGEACGLEKASATGPGDACGAISAEEAKVTEAERHRDATMRVLQTSASARTAATARSTRVSGIGGLTRSATPQLARELRLLQDNFLAQDAVETFLPTCMVELGLHTDAGSTAARALDLLTAAYVNARSEEQQAERDLRATRNGSGGHETAQARYSATTVKRTEAEGALNKFLSGAGQGTLLPSLKQDADPNSQLFAAVLGRWQSGLGEAEEDIGLEMVSTNDVAAAANLNRRSLLAAKCVELLPDHLYWSRRISASYRNKRLEVFRQIELSDRGQQALANRTALLDQFRQSMAACKEGDAKQRSKCETSVRGILDGMGKPVTEEREAADDKPIVGASLDREHE